MEKWILTPSVRREITLELIRRGRTQREISQILKVTEAAISQYKNAKRGKAYQFSDTEMSWIQDTATKIDREPSSALQEVTKVVDKIQQNESSWGLRSRRASIAEG
ncbi:MAG: hypothetical protein ACFFCQ_09865 [Promethearchaeota archaeon]